MPPVTIMGSVKDIIKSSGITQNDLTERLKLSKPTFYSYISLYEKGEKIPRDRYEIIFHELFDDAMISPAEFENQVKWAENMLERDSRFGIDQLKPDDADYAFRTLNLLVKDMEIKDREKSIYIFINSLLTGYRNNEFFKHLCRYFSVMGGAIDVSEMNDDDRPYLANFYRCFKEIKEHPEKYNEEDYTAFTKRCDDLTQERKAKKEREKERLLNAIQEVYKENEGLGITMTESSVMEAAMDRLINGRIEKNEI